MQRSRVINAVGAVMSATVLVVVLITKFQAGRVATRSSPWSSSSSSCSASRSTTPGCATSSRIDWDVERPMLPSHVHAIVLHLQGAQADDARAGLRPGEPPIATSRRSPSTSTPTRPRRCSTSGTSATSRCRSRCCRSPYRQITKPILDYVRSIRSGNPRDIVTVYLPEYVLGQVVGAGAAQPERPAAQGPAALHPGCHGRQRARGSCQSSEGAERDWIDEPPISGSVRGGGAVSGPPERASAPPAASRSSAASGPSRSAPSPTAVTAWPGTRARSSSSATRCPGERVVARVTEGRVGDSFVRADAVDGARGRARPRRGPVPVCRPGPLRRLRLPARVPRRRSGRSRRPSCASSSRASPVSTSTSTCGRCPATRTGLRWRTRVEFAVDGAGRAGPARPPVARRRARRRLPHRHPRGHRLRACSTPSGPTSSRSTSSTPCTPTSRCSSRCPRPRAAARRRARRRARPRRRLGGRVRRRRPGLLAGAPGRGLDLPDPRRRRCSGPSRATASLDLYAGVGPVHDAPRRARRARTASSSASRATAEPSRTASANTEHLDNVEWRANRVDRELRSLVGQDVRSRPRGARPAAHGRRQGGHGSARPDGAPPRRLRRVRPRRPWPATSRRPATHGYDLVSLEAWDAFPMTHHVECIAVLEPRGESSRPSA